VDDHGRGADLRRGVAGLLEDLPRAVADVVLGRTDVDQVGSVDVDVDRGGAELIRVGAGRRLAPGLRMREEDLNGLGADRLRLGEGLCGGEMSADRERQKIGDSV
jgi:hypothetical protein